VGLTAPPPPSQAFGGPPEPASAAVSEPAGFEDVGVRVRRAPTYKKSSGTGGTLMVLALLVAVAAGLAAYVMKKPELMKKLFGSSKEVAVDSQAEGPKETAPADHGAAPVRPNPPSTPPAGNDPAPPLKDGLDALPGRKPVRRMDKADDSPAADRGPDDESKMRANKPATPDEPVKPGSTDDSMPAKPAGSNPDAPKPDEPAPPSPPAVDAEQLDASLRAVFSFLRHHDFDGAAARIKKAAEIAAADPEAVNRVQLWERFVSYARDFSGHLDKALEAKKDGGEFQYKGRPVAIVEVDRKVFKYRDKGGTSTVPRGEIPDDSAIAIVAQWFAGDGRPANHVFLGARELARRKPAVDAARAAWQQAADGGEAEGKALQALFDDPVIRDAAK